MAVRLSQPQLRKLLPWLGQHLPHSFKVHGDLLTHLKGLLPGLGIFVDRWPHPQAVVARMDPDEEKLDYVKYYRKVVHGMFGVNDEAVSRLVQDPSVVDWDRHSMFEAMPDSLETVMKAVAEQMGFRPLFHHNYLLKGNPQDIKPAVLPEGTMMRTLSSDDVGFIRSTLEVPTEGSEAFIEDLVQRFPSVCMMTDQGHYIGHALGRNYNTTGMLHVNPEFRGKGYGSIISRELYQKYFELDTDVYCFVNDANQPSLALLESIGGRVVPDVKMVYMYTKPGEVLMN